MGTGAKEVLANTSAATIAGAVSLGGASAKLTNGGKIDGSVTTGSSATLNNAGSIIGLVTLAEGSDTVANSGAISGSVMFTATAQGGDQLKNTGSISQGVVMGSGAGELLVNASGASIGERLSSGGSTATVYSVLFVGASGVLRNGGKIDGDVGMDFKSSKLTNTGSINGAVTLGADGVLTNAGSIVGAVSLTVGDGALTNSGSITGAISIFGADVNSVETNTGTIVGSVTVSGSGYTFNNHNQIYGDVTFGSGDTLTNTGVIHGNLILNNADTVNTSRGLVTGTIMADHDDNQMFIFSGGFGHETIDGFSAGSATTHDTLQFAADDFGSYADVQAAMTQVGKDVLIKLDAADTIVLDGVTIGTKPGDLTAADFKFV
jgi:adhesin HecA-like repeat protein